MGHEWALKLTDRPVGVNHFFAVAQAIRNGWRIRRELRPPTFGILLLTGPLWGKM